MNHEEPRVSAFSCSEVKLFRYLDTGLFEHNSLKSWAFSSSLYFPQVPHLVLEDKLLGFSAFDFADKSNLIKITDDGLVLVWVFSSFFV